MTVSADACLVSKNAVQRPKRLGVLGMVPNGPTPGKWVSIEEHGCSLKKDCSGLVEAEGFPEAGFDTLGRGDAVSW